MINITLVFNFFVALLLGCIVGTLIYLTKKKFFPQVRQAPKTRDNDELTEVKDTNLSIIEDQSGDQNDSMYTESQHVPNVDVDTDVDTDANNNNNNNVFVNNERVLPTITEIDDNVQEPLINNNTAHESINNTAHELINNTAHESINNTAHESINNTAHESTNDAAQGLINNTAQGLINNMHESNLFDMNKDADLMILVPNSNKKKKLPLKKKDV
jgi:hypothetical protein